MKRPDINKSIVHSIMDRAVLINKNTKQLCRDFTIMVSPHFENVLILRWTVINIDNPQRPSQCYRYECFELDGSPQLCSIYYADVIEANAFFNSLTPLFMQEYANSHTVI